MRLLIIFLFISQYAFSQVKEGEVYLTDGLYAKDSATIGIEDGSITMDKLATPPNTILEYKKVVGDGYNKQFTFSRVPDDYDDYMIFKGKYILWPEVEYKTVGNTITILKKCYSGDRITYWRLK